MAVNPLKVRVIRIVVLAAIVLVLRTRVFKLLSNWLDRRFFREAYDTEKQLLIEIVTKRISEVLHVPQMAVWVRGSNVFHPQEVIGFSLSEPVLLSKKSPTVQELVRSH